MNKLKIICLFFTASFAGSSDIDGSQDAQSCVRTQHFVASQSFFGDIKDQLKVENFLQSVVHQQDKASFHSRHYTPYDSTSQSIESLRRDVETVQDIILDIMTVLNNSIDKMTIGQFKNDSLKECDIAAYYALQKMTEIANGESSILMPYDAKGKKCLITLCALKSELKKAEDKVSACLKEIEKLKIKQAAEESDESLLVLQRKEYELTLLEYNMKVLQSLNFTQDIITRPIKPNHMLDHSFISADCCNKIESIMNYVRSANDKGLLVDEMIKDGNKILYVFAVNHISLGAWVLPVTLCDVSNFDDQDI